MQKVIDQWEASIVQKEAQIFHVTGHVKVIRSCIEGHVMSTFFIVSNVQSSACAACALMHATARVRCACIHSYIHVWALYHVKMYTMLRLLRGSDVHTHILMSIYGYRVYSRDLHVTCHVENPGFLLDNDSNAGLPLVNYFLHVTCLAMKSSESTKE